MARKIKVTIVLILTSACLFLGQNNARCQLVSKFSGWFSVSQNISLKNKFSIQFDSQFRTDAKWENAETIISRLGLSYALNKTYSIAAGYIFVENWKVLDKIRDNTTDHRIWQQVSSAIPLGKTLFQQRIRIEERWISLLVVENNRFKKTDNFFNTRLRPWVRWTVPISRKQLTHGYYIALQNEIILNMTGGSHANNKIFEQSRTYAGLGYKINKHADLEAGYMLLFGKGRNHESTINNIFQLSSFLRWNN